MEAVFSTEMLDGMREVKELRVGWIYLAQDRDQWQAVVCLLVL
jgi:hypothetical protein